MPQHKSCIKRLKQSGNEKVRNNALRTVLKKTIKQARLKIAAGETLDIDRVYANIDKIQGKGIIPKNRAARLKSRLTRAAAKASAKA